MSANGYSNGVSGDLRYVPLSYNNAESRTSALRLVLTIFPDWEHSEGDVEFVCFTDGITNTVCISQAGLLHWPLLRVQNLSFSKPLNEGQATPMSRSIKKRCFYERTGREQKFS